MLPAQGTRPVNGSFTFLPLMRVKGCSMPASRCGPPGPMFAQPLVASSGGVCCPSCKVTWKMGPPVKASPLALVRPGQAFGWQLAFLASGGGRISLEQLPHGSLCRDSHKPLVTQSATM